MTPAGIEAATFRFVARHLNHCATAVPPYWLPYKGKASQEKIVEEWFLCIYVFEVQGKKSPKFVTVTEDI